MSGTVLDEETTVVDLTHLDFEIPCVDKHAESCPADVYLVCRGCAKHVPYCDPHAEALRASFRRHEAMAHAAGFTTGLASCKQCGFTTDTFDELAYTVPVKP